MDNNITITPTVASAARSADIPPTAATCPLPVSNILNVQHLAPGDSRYTRHPVCSDGELFFDALETHQTSSGWPSFSALSTLVKEAIHHQLNRLSRTAVAASLLHMMPADLSKLLAAVLICSHPGKELLSLAGYLGGMELINQLIHTVAGASSTAAILSSLPGLLLVWLQRHHLSLSESLTDSCLILLSSGLALCAAADITQPGWLLSLHEQVIAPVTQLCAESGFTTLVTTGITLIVGLYAMLRLSGGSADRIPQANILTHGARIIQGLWALSAKSQDYQRLYSLARPQRQIKSWYQLTHGKPYREYQAEKALERAVLRCLPKEVLRQNDNSEQFHQAYQQTEQHILNQQLSVCPQDGRDIRPLTHAERKPSATAITEDTLLSAASEGASASVPLLVSGAVIAGAAASPSWWKGRTALSLATTGITLASVAGMRYLRQAPEPEAEADKTNVCINMINVIKRFLASDNTGATLAVELFSWLFDEKNNLNLVRADLLLDSLNITSFRSIDYHNMNDQLVIILSYLLSGENRNTPEEVDNIILKIHAGYISTWYKFVVEKKNDAIKNILNDLRKECAKEYLVRGIHSRFGMGKITEFILSQIVPNLLFMEKNGRSHEPLISKNGYYLWNYIGRKLLENRDFSGESLITALREGFIDGFFISGLRSYDNQNISAPEVVEELKEEYDAINRNAAAYHKQDKELAKLPIITLDDIIKKFYPEIDIDAKQNFNILSLLVRTEGHMDNHTKILIDCTSFRDLIRNLDDGFTLLHQLLPQKTPETLRDYNISGKRKSFSLKKHPTRAELYHEFEKSYQDMCEKHLSLYNDIVDKAFMNLPEDDFDFLHHSDTCFIAIDFEFKRLSYFHYFFYPKFFRLRPAIREKVLYNVRPHYKVGNFFIAWNPKTREKRYYLLQIEYIRSHFRQLPIWRLPINKTEEIPGLEQSVLDENFVFTDQQPFTDSCSEIKEPNTTIHSHMSKTGHFFTERYHKYKNELCVTFQPERKNIVIFKERQLGDKNSVSMRMLKKEISKNREDFLSYMKTAAINSTETEKNSARSALDNFIQTLPLYNCYELARDYIFSREDNAPPSTIIPTLQALICFGDIYGMRGFSQKISALLQSIKKKYVSRLLKEQQIQKLAIKVDSALKRTVASSYSDSLQIQINVIRDEIEKIDDEIIALRDDINLLLKDVAAIPPLIAFPYLAVGSKKGYLASIFPWAVGTIKTGAKKLLLHKRKTRFGFQWQNPLGDKLFEHELYTLPEPALINQTCTPGKTSAENITLNVFNLFYNDKALYQQLLFTALRTRDPQAVIATAREHRWIFPENYNQMAMFCFIALTIPIIHYTNMVLTMEDYFKTDKNDVKVTEAALWRYYHDVQERPYIKPAVELQDAQQQLIKQASDIVSNTLQGTIQAIEANYLFMLQFFLMREDVVALVQAMGASPAARQTALTRWQRELNFNLERFTLYGASLSSVQMKFHAAAVGQFAQYCQQAVSSQPHAIMLFSHNMETFLERREQYRRDHPAATLSSADDFTRNWLQIARDLSALYQSFARLEYSAKVLANYPPDQWEGTAAQSAWRAAMQPWLLEEMHYENFQPALSEAGKYLAQYWQQRQTGAGDKLEIIENGVINPLFIADVSRALTESCRHYPRLYFCRVWLTDNGRWFTFLTNEYMPDSHTVRARRQTDGPHSAYPLAQPDYQALNETVALPLDKSQLWALESFVHFASQPFHLRLNIYRQDALPVKALTRRDAVALINHLIDEQGNLRDYQVMVLSRYFPSLNVADDFPPLQLLSDIFQLTTPDTPGLYQFIFHYLQHKLARGTHKLSILLTREFVASESQAIYRQLTAQLDDIDKPAEQALRHFITATLQHLLSFTRGLHHVESRLTAAPLQNFSSRLLCIGAIIAHQLRLNATADADFLHLTWEALHDAGLLSLRETAIQQIALISGQQPVTGQQQQATDALQLIAASVQSAMQLQQRLQNCLRHNQWLAGFLHLLTFSGFSAEQQQQLSSMIKTSAQQQHHLLQLALQQLPADDSMQLADALQKAELQVSWYAEWRNTLQSVSVAGLGFHTYQQQGIVLPLGDPHSIPLIFRQLSRSADAHELISLCFADTQTPHTLAAPVQIILAGNQSVTDPATALSLWMQQQMDKLCTSLMRTESESAFTQQKKQLERWLSQHLFFYDRDDNYDYRFIQQQTHQLVTIASHVDLAGWQQPHHLRAPDLPPVADFNQAITNVMGAETRWPFLTTALKERGQRYSPTPLSALPADGFAGFWWDPVSRVCYLGWKQGEERMLYVSLAENRQALYPLPDDSASAAIWLALNPSDLLSYSLQALRHGEISALTFFDDSVPLAWQLQSAISNAPPLPPNAIPTLFSGVARLYISGSGSDLQYYFSPAAGSAALPVSASAFSHGGWRIAYTPSADRTSPDQGFSLETQPFNTDWQHTWSLTASSRWQLQPAQNASQLIRAGNFSPVAYLQWGDGATHCASMTPAAPVLQGSDGSMVFIFSEDDYRRISYRVLDPQGTLCRSPQIPLSWPQSSTATSAQQFDAQLEAFISQLEPDYWPLLPADEGERLKRELAGLQQHRHSAFTAATKAIGWFPFRTTSPQLDMSELMDVLLYLRSSGRHFDNELKQGTLLQDTDITLSSLLSNPLSWREFDLYREDERRTAERFITVRIAMLQKALTLLKKDPMLDSLSGALQEGIEQAITLQKQAKSAIEFIKQHSDLPANDDAAFLLQRHCFAQNNFFSYYQQQLHITPELFAQPWPCLRNQSWPAASRLTWQPVLDQLHSLATALPPDEKVLNRLLTLSAQQWHTPETLQRAAAWRQICDGALGYWQSSHRAEQLIMLRPQATAGNAELMPVRHHWPVRLILAAGIGDPTSNHTAGIAPARRITAEQQEDLLLTPVGPARHPEPAPRLAGISAQPQTIGKFAAWVKLRLSSPWALAAFSGPSFCLRLQNRIRQVIGNEQAHWSTEEQRFYHAADTQLFLQEDQPEQLDKRRYGAFFRQLYNSESLVIRLVMTDEEMVFGLLCEYFAAQYPQRATEEIAAAWFLFQQTFTRRTDEENQQQLYLVGV
ncbi:hypothetical protein J2125_001698 [Erwinia toletana]|uniref:Uncharacterized protein n=1 Tax=Winslowiella toletana TaxID=92490 RepID=A0ABS4P8S0_9GAMM|nr:hypothetical protein [Winslowiella toletana]MBP2168506.1 hypothetical protein [Winslowiella toletana]